MEGTLSLSGTKHLPRSATDGLDAIDEEIGGGAVLIPDVVFHLIDSLMDAISLVQQHHSSKAPSKSVLQPIQALTSGLIYDLKRIDDYLQNFLTASFGDDSVLHTAIEHLNNIDSALDHLVSNLRGSSISQYEVTHAHGELMELVNLDPRVRRRRTYEPDNPSSLSEVAQLLANPRAGTSDPPTLSPLEHFLRESGIPRMYQVTGVVGPKKLRSYPLAALTEWATESDPHYISSSHLGTLQSIYLFRERKPLIYHEFVILCFRNNDGKKSCLRAERAPDGVKTNAHPRGTLIRGGATLLESVAFATSIDDLVDETYDEIASVTVTHHRDHNRALEKVGRLALEQLGAADAAPRYLLLSENCRWFARRNVLSIVEQLSHSKLPHDISWRTKPSQYQTLVDKLKKNRFGGRQLQQGNIEVRNLINNTWKVYSQELPNEALESTHKALELIRKMSRRSVERDYLHSVTLRLQGFALRDVGRIPEAIDSFQKALVIGQRIRSTNRYAFIDAQDSLATLLNQTNQLEAALALRKAAIDELRAHITKTSQSPLRLTRTADYRADQRTAGHRLATVLHNYAADLSRFPGREAERLKVYEEEVALHKKLERNRPDRFRHGLGVAMMEYATALDGMDSPEEAIEISRGAIALAKAVFSVNPNYFRRFLAISLYNHSRYASRLKLWDEACRTGSEVVRQYRQLYVDIGVARLGDYRDALINYGFDLRSAGRTREAVETFEEALNIVRSHPASDPAAQRDIVTALLGTIADLKIPPLLPSPSSPSAPSSSSRRIISSQSRS